MHPIAAYLYMLFVHISAFTKHPGIPPAYTLHTPRDVESRADSRRDLASPPLPLQPAATLWKLTRCAEIDCLQARDKRADLPRSPGWWSHHQCVHDEALDLAGRLPRSSRGYTIYLAKLSILITRPDVRRSSNRRGIRAGSIGDNRLRNREP